MSRKIQVEILGDSKSLEAALGRSQQKTSKFGRGLAVASKVAAGALVGLGLAAKVGFDEINDSQKVMAQTQAVLKSTGGEANVTAKHVDTLAQSLLHLSGVDDETIASGENMLLTFRNIHNEVGKGNDIFDQATKATLDLSVAMGKDMKSSAILVGKALNDPIKGMTALRRVGVSLSDAQEKLITHLVKTGHTAKAQKIILGELTKEFGGSAKAAGMTLSGQLGKLRESFADVAANLVTALLPAVTSLIGVLGSAAEWMKKNQEATKIIVATIAALSVGVIAVNAAYKAWGAITAIVTAAQWALNASLFANPIYDIIFLIIALGVALVVAYHKSETFRNIVNAAFNAVKAVAGAVVGFIRDHWKLLVAVIGGPMIAALVLVATHLGTLKSIAGRVLGFFKAQWQNVVGPIQSVVRWVEAVIEKIQTLISWIGQIHFPSVPGFGGGAANAVPTRFGGSGPKATGSSRPAVTGGTHVSVVKLDGRTIAHAVADYDKTYRRQNGRSLFA